MTAAGSVPDLPVSRALVDGIAEAFRAPASTPNSARHCTRFFSTRVWVRRA